MNQLTTQIKEYQWPHPVGTMLDCYGDKVTVLEWFIKFSRIAFKYVHVEGHVDWFYWDDEDFKPV